VVRYYPALIELASREMFDAGRWVWIKYIFIVGVEDVP
jgi:hypothetical protein